MRWFVCCPALLFVIICTSPLMADEPKQKDQKAEPLPAPKVVVPDPVIITPAWPQAGTREIWQNYGVDGRGRFLPRVMYHPAGSFYLRDGSPYPWTTTRPTLFMPYAID